MAPPSATSPDLKPYGITNIKAYVPLILDLNELTYDAWRELFETHCTGFSVIGHLDGASQPTRPDDIEWHKLDSLVKMWIYGTITQPLLTMILKKGIIARDVWSSLESLFRDNKDARAIELDNELRNMVLGDLSITQYCHKIKVVHDTVNVGTETAATLKGQTEQMNRIVDDLDSIHFSIKKASRLVKELGRQVATDRCIMSMLFLIVMGVIAIIIVKVMHPENKDIQDIPGLAPPAVSRKLLWFSD